MHCITIKGKTGKRPVISMAAGLPARISNAMNEILLGCLLFIR
jgi:hypothetical protein